MVDSLKPGLFPKEETRSVAAIDPITDGVLKKDCVLQPSDLAGTLQHDLLHSLIDPEFFPATDAHHRHPHQTFILITFVERCEDFRLRLDTDYFPGLKVQNLRLVSATPLPTRAIAGSCDGTSNPQNGDSERFTQAAILHLPEQLIRPGRARGPQ